ncbi:hypothetical protein [Acinetobacter baumannii]|nr:hypothetical protein [Acinetobacter baumannii]
MIHAVVVRVMTQKLLKVVKKEILYMSILKMADGVGALKTRMLQEMI